MTMNDTAPPHQEDDAPPPPNFALLKGLVAFLGMLLLAGFLLLAVLLFTRGAGEMEEASSAAAERRVALLPGEVVTERVVSAEGAALIVQGPEGTRILFLDPRNGAVTAFTLPANGD